MKLYLSSFRIGSEPDKLVSLVGGRAIGLIPNALDFVEPAAYETSTAAALREVQDLGIDVELLDLKEYFGREPDLEALLPTLGGVWVRGGNTFVLRQAMRLSGFDRAIHEMRADFVYGGYSGGICVLAPSLDGLQHVDDPTVMPYDNSDVVWEGLGIVPYLILPHYKSDHPESANIDTEVEYCEANGIAYRPLRDGEVIIGET